MATTRLPDTREARDRRADDARHAAAYLIRTGNTDLLDVLGLSGTTGERRCAGPKCGEKFLPTATGGKQVCCSKRCASRLASAERRANASERMSAKANGNV